MSSPSASGQEQMWPGARPEVPPAEGHPVAAEQEPAGEPRLKQVNRNQLLLRTVEVEKLVEPDHPVRAIWELVGQLDLSRFLQPIEAVEGVAGRPAWDPHLLISLWIYAYSEGVSSAREVERRCAYHPVYQWLTGWQHINHHTLSDFRVSHQQALDDLFAQVLGVLSAEGLITLERVMHDGTKVKAAASRKSFHREETLRAHLEAARQHVEQMGDPRQEELSPRQARARERAAREKKERLQRALEEMQKVQAAPHAESDPAQRRVSETDPEARIMKQGDGGYAPSHNLQISTDAAHSLIVGVGVTQSASDQGQLMPALDQIQENLGQLPRQVVVDGGFMTRETVVAVAERGVELFGGEMGTVSPEATARSFERRGTPPEFRSEAFAYDASSNTYTCPAGKVLNYQGQINSRIGVTRHQYQARATDCQACSFRPQCCPRASTGRTLVRSENVPVVAAFLSKMQTEAAQQIYRLRGAIAEFPHAWLKAKIGLRQFRVRGLGKVRMEALWACLAYNLQQWIRLCWKVRLVQASA
jgi:transposase